MLKTALAFVFVASSAAAGGHGAPSTATPPDVYLTPDEYGISYTFRYVNHPTTSGDNRTEETLPIGDISWSIAVTPNEPCRLGAAAETCADTIVITPPEGYIAIPGGPITVEERKYIDVLIVPEGIS